MIKDIINEVINESTDVVEDVETLSKSIFNIFKDFAKKVFFEGKINDLKDYIFDTPNPNNEEINRRLKEELRDVTESGDFFIQKIKEKITSKVEDLKAEKNIDSLLDLFDYSHLKDMLKMFRF